MCATTTTTHLGYAVSRSTPTRHACCSTADRSPSQEWPFTTRKCRRQRTAIPPAVHADLLRTNHVPGNPALLMLADRLGLAVWEEIPLNHYTPETFSLVMARGIPQQMLAEMALRDFNRPSVMFHGFANESTGTSERTSAMQTLHDLDRKIDGTRLTGQAMYGSNPTDPTSSPLDVAGYTFYYGVFYGGLQPEPGTSHALQLAHQTYPKKPVMILEFGE